MATGDVTEVVLHSTYLAQHCINVFHYEQQDGVSGDLDQEAFALEFMTAWLPALEAVQSSGVTYFQIDVRGIYGYFAEYTEDLTGEAGAVGGDTMPPFVAFSWLMRRTTKDTFNGHKRFTGVPESSQSGGTAVGGIASDIAAVTDLMPYHMTTETRDLAPVIVSKTLNGVARSPWYFNTIQAGVFKGITTQNSRKYGRGD